MKKANKKAGGICVGCTHYTVCMYRNMSKGILLCDKYRSEDENRLQQEVDRLRKENEDLRKAALADIEILVFTEDPCNVCAQFAYCTKDKMDRCQKLHDFVWRGEEGVAGGQMCT